MKRAFERNPIVMRLTAIFLLAIFLPAAAIAAPLRYCVGQNGHRAIELWHAKDLHQAKMHASIRVPAPQRSPAAVHYPMRKCVDKILLPIVAQSDARFLAAAGQDPTVESVDELRLASRAKRLTNVKLHVEYPTARQSDPRLRMLKTVVLLN